MLRRMISVVACFSLLAGVSALVLGSDAGDLGSLRGGCPECETNDVCVDGTIQCKDYDGQPTNCNSATEIQGVSSNRAYSCTGDPAPACQLSDNGPCRLFYDCEYNDGTDACEAPDSHDGYPATAYNNCCDDPPC